MSVDHSVDAWGNERNFSGQGEIQRLCRFCREKGYTGEHDRACPGREHNIVTFHPNDPITHIAPTRRLQ